MPGTAGAGTIDLVVLNSPSVPSYAQQASALATMPGPAVPLPLPVLSPRRVAARVRSMSPDIVVLACTGPAVHLVTRRMAGGRLAGSVRRRASRDRSNRRRPIIVSGLPGVALPATERAWLFRGGIDLFVVNSHRELAEYTAVRDRVGASGRVGLAHLPFLERIGPQPRTASPQAVRREVVFATQGKVPAQRSQRLDVLRALGDLGLARPDLCVVVKTRGERGEFHTHYEAYPYHDLWDELRATEPRYEGALSFSAASMSGHLDRAEALVTVSSTAALEAMARRIPVLLIDEFGVGPEQINEAFDGCGCMAGLDNVRAGRFGRADEAWLEANYLHDAGQDTWVAELTAFGALGAPQPSTGLPSVAQRLAQVEQGFRAARPWWRRRILDPLRSTTGGRSLARSVNGWRVRTR